MHIYHGIPALRAVTMKETYSAEKRYCCRSIQFDFIIDICAVFCCISTGCSSHHVVLRHALVFTYSALLVSAECITCQVSVLCIEALFCFLCFLDVGLPCVSISSLQLQRDQLTLINAATKSSGKPYRSTLSTKHRSTITCTRHMTASLQPVLPNLNVSPHILFSSASVFLSSFCSSSLPPSLNLKSRGIHFLSLHLCTNS